MISEVEKTKKQINCNSTELERGIDVLVYKLYDLTEEEIAIVEGDF